MPPSPRHSENLENFCECNEHLIFLLFFFGFAYAYRLTQLTTGSLVRFVTICLISQQIPDRSPEWLIGRLSKDFVIPINNAKKSPWTGFRVSLWQDKQGFRDLIICFILIILPTLRNHRFRFPCQRGTLFYNNFKTQPLALSCQEEALKRLVTFLPVFPTKKEVVETSFSNI